MNKLTQFKVILVGTVALTVGVTLALTHRIETVERSYTVSVPQVFSIPDPPPPPKPRLIPNAADKIKLSATEFDCLARNIYYEAGIESLEGKIAVAQVTMNRVKSGRWGDTVCRVVYARNQFSWTLDAKKRNQKPAGKLWSDSVAAAQQFLSGDRIYNLDTSLHYHADWIDRPHWAKESLAIKQVGQHIFYHNLR
jgi:spore germination cell wall hydrolase CwlJ-like protein